MPVLSRSIAFMLCLASLAGCPQTATTPATPPVVPTAAPAAAQPPAAQPPATEPTLAPSAPVSTTEDQPANDRQEPSVATAQANTNADSNRQAPLEERLLEELAARRTWKTGHVKIWLQNPTVSVVLTTRDGQQVEVHAWPENQNDYNVAMMRIDRGDVLYAMTAQEYQELAARGAAPRK